MKTRYLTTAFLCVSLIAVSCKDSVTGPQEKGELNRELSVAEKKLVEQGQSFSFNIFEQVSSYDESSENVFISPLSISVALGMTLNGAEGETYEQMKEALAFNGLEMEEINTGYQSLIELLTEADPKVKMQIANSMWSRKGFPIQEDFTGRLQTYFNAEARELDFSDPQSAEIINSWVNDNTNGLIEKIIDGEIPSNMVLYLINAIYFKGDWTYQFDEEDTRERPFYLENGESVTVDMMQQKRDFQYFASDEVQVMDLPYGDSLFSMTVMIPAESDKTIDEFIAEDLTYENYSSWLQNLAPRNIQLYMPKFEMKYKIKLNDVLISMGMEDAFKGGIANFKGINPNAELSISEVMHKTFITVDEKGTEAAAVTSVGVELTSAPPSLNLNRPFVYLIREQNSGAVLFMGKMKNPNP